MEIPTRVPTGVGGRRRGGLKEEKGEGGWEDLQWPGCGEEDGEVTGDEAAAVGRGSCLWARSWVAWHLGGDVRQAVENKLNSELKSTCQRTIVKVVKLAKEEDRESGRFARFGPASAFTKVESGLMTTTEETLEKARAKPVSGGPKEDRFQRLVNKCLKMKAQKRPLNVAAKRPLVTGESGMVREGSCQMLRSR